jgi:hypothetical protein
MYLSYEVLDMLGFSKERRVCRVLVFDKETGIIQPVFRTYVLYFKYYYEIEQNTTVALLSALGHLVWTRREP